MRWAISRGGVVVCAVALAALCAPSVASAQDAGSASGNLLGKPHTFVVPPGWTATPTKDNVSFAPPAGKMRGNFMCFVAAFEGDVGGTAPKEFAKLVAEDYKKKNMPWGGVTEPDDMTFVNLPGALISVGGTNPDTKQNEAVMFLVAPTKGLVYVFAVAARTDDIQDNAGDLVMIINGVQPASAAVGGGGKNSGGGKNGGGKDGGGKDGGSGAGCVGFGCSAEPPAPVYDPPWGLEVNGLSNKWRVDTVAGSYVFSASKPDAKVTVSHRWANDATVKTSVKKGAKVKLGKWDATLTVTPQAKTWMVPLDKQVTVIELSGPDLGVAEREAWPEFVKALSLVKREPPPVGESKKPVRLTLAYGLSIELAKGWALYDTEAAGAIFRFKEKKGFTWVLVSTMRASGADPFEDEYSSTIFKCKNSGGRPEETPVSVAGATDARLARCVLGAGANQKLAQDVPKLIVMAKGKNTHVLLIAKGEGQDIPEARVKEFLTALSLPH